MRPALNTFWKAFFNGFVSINTGLIDHFCYRQMYFGGPSVFQSGEGDDGESKEEFIFSLYRISFLPSLPLTS